MHIIFTDGASRGNPGSGGWGTIVASEDEVVELGGREDHTTNNRMELMAVIRAFESFPEIRDAAVFSDSTYVISGITRWVRGWKKNNWKTSTKSDVVNQDLWQRLLEASKHKSIEWKLLKGHSGIKANERCDVIATGYADGTPPVLYIGSRVRYGTSLDVAEVKNSVVSKTKSRTRPYSYVSEVEGIVVVHSTWEECFARITGKSKARFKKVMSREEEEEIVKEFSDK